MNTYQLTNQALPTTMDVTSARLFIALLSIISSFIISSSLPTPDSLHSRQSLTGNDTLVSTSDNFVLGFFTPAASSGRWYLGIWYKRVVGQVVVWVANRDTPITGQVRKLSLTKNGNLLISNGANKILWSSGTGDKNLSDPVARLTKDGNFVVMDQKSNIHWQSFDHPTDTMLPGMKIGVDIRRGVNFNLTSWKSDDDPSPGNYSLGIDFRGVPEFVLYYGSSPKWRLGPWNGKTWSQVPDVTTIPYMNFSFYATKYEAWHTLQVRENFISSLMVNESRGQMVLRIISSSVNQSWPTPNEKCSIYGQCGAYGVCIGSEAKCTCMEGFELKRTTNNTNILSSRDCVRRVPLDCKPGSSSFVEIRGLKLPDTSVAVRFDELDIQGCERRCMANCSCMAYSTVNYDGSGCLMWFGDLLDVRMQPGGSDVYVKVNLQLPRPSVSGKNHPKPKKKPKVIVIPVICTVVGTIFLTVLICLFIWKHKNKRKGCDGEEEDNLDLPILDYSTLASATHNFSDENKLGEGGFGPVYKCTLADGQEVAVKRLSKCSKQGIKEFKNEVLLIAKLQHRNLVRLLACCIHGDDRLLIYEYMINKSLDGFLFGNVENEGLNWQTRYQIVMGITKGLLYLHQDSRLRIIHRDLKAANILLDKDMNPKISDFGTARIFGGDGTEVNNTLRVVGTYGYMSPEYALDGIFSVKSDVFSFGVLLLEIVSGVKNKAIFQANPQENLIGHAWGLWSEGRGVDLMDPSMVRPFDEGEVLKCIKIGLLCVQEQPNDRPSMSSVLHILGCNIESIPEPKQPGYVTIGAPTETETSSSAHPISSSSNSMSMTMFTGR